MTKKKIIPLRKFGLRILVICFWLLVWEIASRIMNEDILLVSPFTVVQTIFTLAGQNTFWQTIGFSFIRIVLGFLLALMTGTLVAVLSYNNHLLKELITPLMRVIKATPVASFIILALIWIQSKNLSVFISYLMVLPIVYSNVYQGLILADIKLLEMAKVFHLGRYKKIVAIYLPSVMPYFISAVSVGLGFCWKAGIAAEVIGKPSNSIGKYLYESKLYLMTDELFAWTVVIIIISVLFEKIIMYLLKPLQTVTKENTHT